MSVLFWIGVVLLAGGGFALASRPLWADRRAAPSTAAHDVSVYKSQLQEIDRDLGRGVISAEEAEGARREIARRLLAADAALAAEEAFAPAPKTAARGALLAFFAPALLAALGLYFMLGAPSKPGSPWAERDLAQERAAALLPQAEAEARARAAGLPQPEAPDPESAELIAQMRAALEQRPEDPRGRILLGRALVRMQRPAEAWPLFARAAELQGEAASPQLYAQMGEAMMLAAGGYVSREGEAAFRRAPGQAISRYMLGVADAQRGAYEPALQRWSALYMEQRDAPFAETLLEQIKRAAAALEMDPEALAARLGAPASAPAETPEGGAAVAAAPGPDAEQIAEAAEMSAEDRQAMIEGMVSRLADRLEEDPKDLEGWLRLIRAYGVMGRGEEAAGALAAARTTFAGDDAALSRLAEAERALGAAATRSQ